MGFYTVAGHYVAALVTYSWIALVLYTIQTLYFLPFVTVEAWGAFKADTIPLNDVADKQAEAVMIFDRAGWR